ncbi:MAG: glutaredoxin domain-containing protein [Candidatus Nanoarchaeia archaeon]
MTRDIVREIQDIIDSNQVVLFLKGEKGSHMCGFSQQVLMIFEQLQETFGVDIYVVNVWKDQTLYDTLKEYNDWPTYPQIFINHEFVGGFDIIQELEMSGELEEMMKSISSN